MMLAKVEAGKNSGEDSSSGRLLRDIEAINKALYLHNTPSKGLTGQSDIRSRSTGKTHFYDSNSKSTLRFVKEDTLHKDKKLSIWNWKPLKALSHIRNHRFSCCFFLYVHSIEGLPLNFNDSSLCVHWKRKDEGLQTRMSRVYQGIAEFDETLMHRCSVYGSRNGPHHSAKYEAKLFLLYASVIGAPGLDIGKHWIDLTRLLPLNLEELEEEKSLGKWTTSFKLSGKAKGAMLNVSFGFSVLGDNSVESSSNMNVPEILKVNQNRLSERAADLGPGNGNGMLRRVGSVPTNSNHGSHLPSRSVDVEILHEVLPNPVLELSRSINFLYQKLDEGKVGSLAEFDFFSEHVEPLKWKPDLFSHHANEITLNECDDTEFIVTEKGIELSTKEQLNLEEGSAIEIIHLAKIFKDDGISLDDETKSNSMDEVYVDYKNEVVVGDCKYEENNICTKESTMEELESAFHSLSILESAELESPLAMSEFLEQENYMEVKSNHKASKLVKSLSLDDVTESVAIDFLNMLGTEHSPFGLSSDSDPESPRERLLRQFEKDSLASGNFIFDFDAEGEQAEFACAAPTGSVSGDFSGDFELSSAIQAAEEEHERVSQMLRSKRKAKMLEDLETEALMREWGLNEKVFQSSPRKSSGGFGSPIYIPPEEPLELPSLGEGLGPFVRTTGGGFLRSMNPSLFRNAKNGGSLIMQVSSPVVLPAEMGYGVMEILQHLASVGIEKLSMQANKLMPLEDITGKTIQQVAWEAETILEVPERQALLQHELEVAPDSFGGRKKGFPSGQSYDSLNSSSIGGEMGSDYVSLEDLGPLAMDKFETLSIEGLRIQSGMSCEEAPSSISPQFIGKPSAFEGKTVHFGRSLGLEGAAGLQLLDVKDSGDDIDGLMGLSITLDEWMRLDAGIIGDEDQISERTSKILAAHHAKYTDLINGRMSRDRKLGIASGRKCGLLGNNLTLALMVQLRDPLRDYEPVGAPMLALIQMERGFVSPKPKTYGTGLERSNNRDEDDQYELLVKEDINDERKGEKDDGEDGDIPQFKITEVHVAGLNTEPGQKNWGTTAQQQSGSRWLLASGMGKTNNHPFLKLKAIVKSSSQVRTKVRPRDTLWSISSHVHGTGAKWKELVALTSHIRNPNVIFPNETIRLR